MGYSRAALWRDQPVELEAFLAGSYEWALLDKPPTSAAALSSSTAQTTSFTPDVNGTYRIRLIAGKDTKVLVARVDRDSAGVRDGIWALPAFQESVGEDNAGGNVRGSTPVLEAIFDEIWSTISGGIPSAPSGAAGGDLAGTYPNPAVSKVDGVAFDMALAGPGAVIVGGLSGFECIPDPGASSLFIFDTTPQWSEAPELQIPVYFASYAGHPDHGLQLGSGSLDVSGSGTLNLTTQNLQNHVVRLDGTLTGNRTLVVPLGNGRPHLFVNQTLGDYLVRIQAPYGGFTYLLPGQARRIWVDDNGVLRGEGLDVMELARSIDMTGDTSAADVERVLCVLPPNTVVDRVEQLTLTSPSDAAHVSSVGTEPGGMSPGYQDLLLRATTPVAGSAPVGKAAASLGTSMSTDGSAFYPTSVTVKHVSRPTATLTTGKVRVRLIARYLGE